MRHKRQLAAVLVMSVTAVFAGTGIAQAHNVYNGAYRKWPWKAGVTYLITNPPCHYDTTPTSSGSHCRETNQEAIDGGLPEGTKVYSLSPGTYYTRGCPTSSATGNYVVIKDDDGNYITYEHLKYCTSFSSGTHFLGGQPFLTSGSTGTTGAHLHFQRASRPPTWSSSTDRQYQLYVDPLSGHGYGMDGSFEGDNETSDNAAVGYDSGDSKSSSFASAYSSAGGYSLFGATSHIGASWTPCGLDTYFRAACNTSNGWTGSVQTFYYGTKLNERAIAQGTGYSAFVIYRGILGAYASSYNSHGLVYWLGYPMGNRYVYSSGIYRQDFESGFIQYVTSTCATNAYWLNDTLTPPRYTLIKSTSYCDAK
jgi:Peptidase family M23